MLVLQLHLSLVRFPTSLPLLINLHFHCCYHSLLCYCCCCQCHCAKLLFFQCLLQLCPRFYSMCYQLFLLFFTHSFIFHFVFLGICDDTVCCTPATSKLVLLHAAHRFTSAKISLFGCMLGWWGGHLSTKYLWKTVYILAFFNELV
jgi:hypothetical protein